MKNLKFLALLVFFTHMLTIPAFSMSWKDKIWRELECPSTISGKWIPENRETVSHDLLSIDKKSLIYISKNKKSKNFKIIEKQRTQGERYVFIKIFPINNTSEKETIIKIRPHLVHQEIKGSKRNCSIKVFNFETERQAKKDQYSSWAIYRFKN